MILNKEKSKDGGLMSDVRKVFKEGVKVKTWIAYASLTEVAFYVNQIYWPLFAKSVKGADQYAIGYMAVAMYALPFLLAIPVGRLADMIGRKRTIYLIKPLVVISLLMILYARNSAELIISAVLLGSLTLVGVTRAAISVELVPTNMLSIWFGILGFSGGVVSMVIAPAIGGAIWDLLSPNYVYFFMIFAELISLPLLLKIPETLKRKKA
jgi:MFS family permease